MVAPEALESRISKTAVWFQLTLGQTYQRPHHAHDQVHGAVGPDHDHIAIGDTRIMQIVSEDIGGLVYLAVCKDPLWRSGRLGLDDARGIRRLFYRRTEALVDGPHEA